MAKSEKLKNIDHIPSTSSFLTVNTMIEETRGTNTVFTCYVANYKKLRKGIEYKIYPQKCSHWWTLCFYRRRNLLFVHLDTDILVEEVEFRLRGNGRKIVKSIRKEEIRGGIHAAVFEESVISNPKNLLLINGVLIVQCIYTAKPLEYNIVINRRLQEKSAESLHNPDVIGLCNDLKHLYLNSFSSDFKIITRDVAFKVHRIILSQRSHFFEALFTRFSSDMTDYIEFNASPVITHDILLYMYSGELRDMEFICMLETFYIACKWQITRLVEICIDYFKANFDVGNVLEILCAAYQYEVPELQHEVLSFVKHLPKNIKQRKEWAGIISQMRVISDLPEL